jgi:hypothetical protein
MSRDERDLLDAYFLEIENVTIPAKDTELEDQWARDVADL